MPYPATVFRVMLSGPGDTTKERNLAERLINAWNRDNSFATNRILTPVQWEMDAVPAHGDHPQTLLNKQLVDTSDAIVAIFKLRLGTATPEHVSGTAEEIAEFARAGKEVYVYFYTGAIPQRQRRDAQLDALDSFKTEMHSMGLQFDYDGTAKLETLLRSHLTKLSHSLAGKAAGTTTQDPRSAAIDQFSKAVYAGTLEWQAMARQNVELDRARSVLESHRLDMVNIATELANEVSQEVREQLEVQIREIESLLVPTPAERRDSFYNRNRFWLSGHSILLRSKELLGIFHGNEPPPTAFDPTLAEQYRRSGFPSASYGLYHREPESAVSINVANRGLHPIRIHSLTGLSLRDDESIELPDLIRVEAEAEIVIRLQSIDRAAELVGSSITIEYRDGQGVHHLRGVLPEVKPLHHRDHIKDEAYRELALWMNNPNFGPLAASATRAA